MFSIMKLNQDYYSFSGDFFGCVKGVSGVKNFLKDNGIIFSDEKTLENLSYGQYVLYQSCDIVKEPLRQIFIYSIPGEVFA